MSKPLMVALSSVCLVASLIVHLTTERGGSPGAGWRLIATSAKSSLSQSTAASQSCHWSFASYTSSPWEKRWAENIETWQGPDGPSYEHDVIDFWKEPGMGCDRMREDKARVSAFEKLMPFPPADESLPPDIFSQFTYTWSCGGRQLLVPLEPLVGLLRHPGCVCFDDAKNPYWRMRLCRRHKYACPLMNKDFLLLPTRSKVASDPEGGKAYFFDVGASSYDSGTGGASQKWFVERFAHLGWRFDRILAWEAVQNPAPHTYWSKVPKHIKPSLTYYNIPVSSDRDSPDNPWYYVQKLCTPSDYCLVKIDIDAPQIEEALIEQLLSRSELHPLVDELVWEHHTRRSPLSGSGGWGKVETNSTVATSYNTFLKLRSAGIRAHSWV